MKILVEFDVEIEGEITEQEVFDGFCVWFEPSLWKISPDADDDVFQVWIRGWTVKEAE